MNRIIRALVFSLVLALLSPALALGQVNSPLSSQDMLLQIADNELWSTNLLPDGTLFAIQLLQMENGLPQMELNPSTLQNYELHGVQDVAIFQTAMTPKSAYYADVSTGIQTRVIRFDNAEDAEGYLNAVFDTQVEAVEAGEIPDNQIALIDPLPEFDHPIVGWTSLTGYVSADTGEPTGSVSTVRYHAQLENYLVSVEVYGPFVDYNFDIAWWLLNNAASCVQGSTPCAPVPIPIGNSDYLYIGDTMYFLNTPDDVDGELRWMFPVDSPVRAPNFAVSFGDTAFAQAEEPVVEATESADVQQPAVDDPAGESSGATATVIAASANVRAEPSASAAVVAVGTAGETVTITGESVMAEGYEWVPIITAGGVEGWIASTLIQISD